MDFRIRSGRSLSKKQQSLARGNHGFALIAVMGSLVVVGLLGTTLANTSLNLAKQAKFYDRPQIRHAQFFLENNVSCPLMIGMARKNAPDKCKYRAAERSSCATGRSIPICATNGAADSRIRLIPKQGGIILNDANHGGIEIRAKCIDTFNYEIQVKKSSGWKHAFNLSCL